MEYRALIPLRSRVHSRKHYVPDPTKRFDKEKHLNSPVHSCLKFSAVLYNPNNFDDQSTGLDEMRGTDLGTISLNSSIFSLPTGVSPILMSMKTMGRVTVVGVADMTSGLCQRGLTSPSQVNFPYVQKQCSISDYSPASRMKTSKEHSRSARDPPSYS